MCSRKLEYNASISKILNLVHQPFVLFVLGLEGEHPTVEEVSIQALPVILLYEFTRVFRYNFREFKLIIVEKLISNAFSIELRFDSRSFLLPHKFLPMKFWVIQVLFLRVL